MLIGFELGKRDSEIVVSFVVKRDSEFCSQKLNENVSPGCGSGKKRYCMYGITVKALSFVLGTQKEKIWAWPPTRTLKKPKCL